jgi:hypothetical protein
VSKYHLDFPPSSHLRSWFYITKLTLILQIYLLYRPAQAAFVAVIKAIAEFEPVTVCCNPSQVTTAKTALLPHPNIKLIELPQDDAWFRDTGPTVRYKYILLFVYIEIQFTLQLLWINFKRK